ncbi:MAG: hypothetical protein AB7O43_19290 [Hyphomicrobiaceae bacterium]
MGRETGHLDAESSRVLESAEATDDPRVGYAAVKRRIDGLVAAGEPVPEALLIAARRLSIDCMHESQGR